MCLPEHVRGVRSNHVFSGSFDRVCLQRIPAAARRGLSCLRISLPLPRDSARDTGQQLLDRRAAGALRPMPAGQKTPLPGTQARTMDSRHCPQVASDPQHGLGTGHRLELHVGTVRHRPDTRVELGSGGPVAHDWQIQETTPKGAETQANFWLWRG
jgi:hypothetical protein